MLKKWIFLLIPAGAFAVLWLLKTFTISSQQIESLYDRSSASPKVIRIRESILFPPNPVLEKKLAQQIPSSLCSRTLEKNPKMEWPEAVHTQTNGTHVLYKMEDGKIIRRILVDNEKDEIVEAKSLDFFSSLNSPQDLWSGNLLLKFSDKTLLAEIKKGIIVSIRGPGEGLDCLKVGTQWDCGCQ